MKKKANSKNPQNELLRFEKLLASNLVKNNGGSMPNLLNSSNSVIFEDPLSSNSKINKKINKSIPILNQNTNSTSIQTSLYDSNHIVDTKSLKANIDSIGILNENNVKIFITYFSNLSHNKELSHNNVFTSITSYFSNWSELFIKFFKQFLIEYDVPKCPDYIEKLNIVNDGSMSNNSSYDNNVKNCIFSIYKWNYLLLKIMKFVEEREKQTKNVIEHYESQIEHIQLLKDVVNQRYGKDSAQSLIHKFINEKKKLMKNEPERSLSFNFKKDEFFDIKQFIEKKEAETQTPIVEYTDKSVGTTVVKHKTESIQTSLNGDEIEENFNNISTMSSKIKRLEFQHASSMIELSDLKEDYEKKQEEYKKEMENKVITIQNEYDQLKNNESKLKDKLNYLSKSYNMLKMECESITDSNEKLSEWKNSKELTLSENKKYIDLLNEELTNKVEEIKTLEREFSEYRKNQEATIEANMKEIEELNNKVLNLENDIKVHKVEVSSLTEEINIWKENEKKLKETYGDLHYSLLVAQEENKNYKNKLEENEEKCKKYEAKIKELQSHLYALVENPETEINSSILMTDSLIEEKISANNIKISILEEINDNYRKIQLDKVNTKSINLKEKIEKARKSQELFENERLKKLLQKSKTYEEQMNSYFNSYTPSHPPERKRDIRSASSIATIESIDDDSNYNGMNSKSSFKGSAKNYPNNINSLEYDNIINGENPNNSSNDITPNTNNYFIKPSNSSNTIVSNNSSSNNNNRFPTLNKENETKNINNNKIFWNAPKKNTKLNNIYPTTYTSSIKMAEIIYKGFPRPNKFGNTNSNTNNQTKNNSTNTNKTPLIQKSTSITSSKKPQLQNSINMKMVNKIQTKYPPAELSKYMVPSSVTKEPINKSTHIYTANSIESSIKNSDSKMSKPSTSKRLTFSNTTNYNYSKRKS